MCMLFSLFLLVYLVIWAFGIIFVVLDIKSVKSQSVIFASFWGFSVCFSSLCSILCHGHNCGIPCTRHYTLFCLTSWNKTVHDNSAMYGVIILYMYSTIFSSDLMKPCRRYGKSLSFKQLNSVHREP